MFLAQRIDKMVAYKSFAQCCTRSYTQSVDSQGPLCTTKVDSSRCVGGCFCHSYEKQDIEMQLIDVNLLNGVFLWFSPNSVSTEGFLRQV
jgi:hypothetical protein